MNTTTISRTLETYFKDLSMNGIESETAYRNANGTNHITVDR